MREIVVFSGSAHRAFAERVCESLGVGLSSVELTRFSNDCLQAQLQANCRQRDVFIVQPLSPPKKFDPQSYLTAEAVDPFSNQKLAVALKRDERAPSSLLSAELKRRKEPLEAYPLDTMSMVGSINKVGQPYALLRVDNLLYQVKVGDYIGQNYGRILRVGETELVRLAARKPARAAIVEQVMKQLILTHGTLMPERRAASALPPTAYTCLPHDVREST